MYKARNRFSAYRKTLQCAIDAVFNNIQAGIIDSTDIPFPKTKNSSSRTSHLSLRSKELCRDMHRNLIHLFNPCPISCLEGKPDDQQGSRRQHPQTNARKANLHRGRNPFTCVHTPKRYHFEAMHYTEGLLHLIHASLVYCRGFHDFGA